MSAESSLQDLESTFSPELGLYGAPFNGPGYHSRVANGTWVHATRTNINLADRLLASGEPALVDRGLKIIELLIGLQDQDPVSPTYGIWSWLYEEPLAQMSPPDWNWADFIGLILAKMIVVHADLLPEDLAAAMRQSLGHAARSIFRRNVGAGYTNIAIKGACVTAAAGEILNEPWLLDYGTRRLQSVIDSVHQQGGFYEYNSPTYTRLVMDICETALLILRSPAVRERVEAVHSLEWKFVAAHFHPGTRQLVGPQSRSYKEFLEESWQDFLGARTGLWEPQSPPAPEMRPCPPQYLERMKALPPGGIEARIQHYTRPGGHEMAAHTWLVEDACLGSAADGTFWHQSRPLLGYWNNAEGQPVAIRLRMLKDGKDFASGYVWNAQRANRVLSATNILTNGGDFHPSLDKPANLTFAAQEIALCYQLHGPGGAAKQLGPNLWELSAGNQRAVIHTPPATFDGLAVSWSATTEPELAQVRGSVHLPATTWSPVESGPIHWVTGLELLGPGQEPTLSHIEVGEHEAAGTLRANWDIPGGALSLLAPATPTPDSRVAQFGAAPGAPEPAPGAGDDADRRSGN